MCNEDIAAREIAVANVDRVIVFNAGIDGNVRNCLKMHTLSYTNLTTSCSLDTPLFSLLTDLGVT